MKINRWIALALIALLVVSAMSFVSYRVLASNFGSLASQNCSPEVEEDDASETAEVEDSDTEECGQDNEGEAEEDDANEADEASGQDSSDEIAPATTGITAAEAQAIAEAAHPGTATLNVEFDREGGVDIWEVELDNGLDVQVDASNGNILNTKQRD